MLIVFLLIAFSLGVGYFATQNTGLVHILIGSYLIKDIPLYVIVIGSLLLGVLICWLISLIDSFSSAFTIHGKESEIKKLQKNMEELKEENHDLEIENVKLKEELESASEPAHAVHAITDKPSLYHGIRHAFG